MGLQDWLFASHMCRHTRLWEALGFLGPAGHKLAFGTLGSGMLCWAGLVDLSSPLGTVGMEVHRQTVAGEYWVTLAACPTSHKCVCCDILALQMLCVSASLFSMDGD